MDYHLHSNGQNVGVFPLEQLYDRRLRGELSGADQVWRHGMANWEPLESVLAANGFQIAPAAVAPAPPAPANPVVRARNRALLWGLIGAGALVLIVCGLAGVLLLRYARQSRAAAIGSEPGEARRLAGKQLAETTNTLTEADVLKRHREFRERQYLQAYQKYGKHKQPWDHDARQYFESWLAFNFGGGPTNLPDPKILATKLADNPDCDDPLVLAAASAAVSDFNTKDSCLRRALNGFDKSPYKGYAKFYTAVSLSDRTTFVGNLDQTALRYFKEMLSDGGVLPRDEPEIADIIMNGWGRGFRLRQDAAIFPLAAATKNFKWLGLVLEGEYHIDQAWKARGGGYANTVTAQGWQGFEKNTALAHKAFEQAWNLHPNRVIAPARLIYVTMGESGAEEMRQWFERAIAVQIDYPEAWSSMRWGLRPRWHGDLDAMLALGVTAVQSKRFDTDVPRKLFDVLGDMEQEMKLPAGTHIYGNQEVWPHLKEMYQGYIAAPSRTNEVSGWRAAYATIAFLAGHPDVSREQLQLLDWKPPPAAMTGYGVDLSLMPLIVAGMTGPCSNEVVRAESGYKSRALTEAADLCAALADSGHADDRTREYARARLSAIKREQLLAKSEWIDLLPTGDDDPDWVFFGDKVQRLPDGALEVTAGPYGHGFYSRTRVGPNFEVKGEIEFVKSSNQSFQAGLMMGLPDNTTSHWFAFRLCRNSATGSGVLFGHRFGTPSRSKNFEVANQRNTFDLKYENGKVNAWVNDNQVFENTVLPGTIEPVGPDSMLGLGASNEGGETVLRYRNIKVRRLEPSPSGPAKNNNIP
jgi:hypothetical protein